MPGESPKSAIFRTLQFRFFWGMPGPKSAAKNGRRGNAGLGLGGGGYRAPASPRATLCLLGCKLHGRADRADGRTFIRWGSGRTDAATGCKPTPSDDGRLAARAGGAFAKQTARSLTREASTRRQRAMDKSDWKKEGMAR
jgi:hypothetical protein